MTELIARSELLIRRAVPEVFEAFADPTITTRFWFSHGSARLVAGAELDWTWEMYGFTTHVRVLAIEPHSLIRILWDTENNPTEVEWRFREYRSGQTWIEVENSGFKGDDDARLQAVLDSTEGFALVLAGAKIWLEHGIEPNFVLDRHADKRVDGWKDR
ncbi:SRPBCC family protein [Rhizobium sp. TH2]|uniref:SRPBCC family protein n=1 Tax=Rhizobium sp. TH2 TaxID=2775403 RepID=UPI0021584768|nr:SRPBCC family protein [Rhizobium sp. TH2]UVC10703.1 SRPBCC family protein [Rhizobium sp. TH2]